MAVAFVPVVYAPGYGQMFYQYPPSDPKADAHDLHKAFKGLGTDEKTVIRILAHRSKMQLWQVNQEYKLQSKNHHDLEHAIKHELSGNFQKLAVQLITPTIIVKKDALKNAVEGAGTTERTLIDVLSQATQPEMAEIAADDKLRKHIISDVSGDFKKTIEALLHARRPDFGCIPQERAEELAHVFYKAGEGMLGTDESKFIEIITTNSVEALYQINEVYKIKHKKHGLDKAINSETSGYFKKLLRALIMPRYEYYAYRLHKAIAGLGTDDSGLRYVFTVLDKGELQEVDKYYRARYKEPLRKAVEGDTSGDYKSLLVALLETHQ